MRPCAYIPPEARLYYNKDNEYPQALREHARGFLSSQFCKHVVLMFWISTTCLQNRSMILTLVDPLT
jgi:hypothetical protein